MTFPSDPEIERIHRYITQKKKFKCYMKEIEDRFQDVDNVKSLILSNADVFWVAQLGHNKYEVKPKVSVKICQTYINKNVCSGGCGNLHICRELLLSRYSCRSPCKHGFSHNLENSHNKSIVKDAFPKGSHQIKMNLLRGSFPRLCKRFIDKGKCEKMCCGYFHICPDYLQGKCSKLCCLELRSGVPKRVIHCLSSEHNTRVGKLFFKGFNKSVMITNTLFKHSTAENEQDDNCSEYSANYAQSTVSEDSLLSEDESEIGPYSGRRYPPPSVSLIDLDSAVKPKFELCNNYLLQQCNDQHCLQLHLCKEFLINGNKCEVHCKYGFSHDPFDMHNKRVMFKANFLNVPTTIVMEDIRKSFPRICKDYQEKVCLKNTKCKRVHICEKILHQHVCFVFDCDKCHLFTDDHNSRVLKSYNLSYNSQGLTYILTNLLYSKKMIKGASFKNLVPEKLKVIICFNYVSKSSCNTRKCPHFHICKEFLQSERSGCDGTCGKSHDILDDHNKWIIQQQCQTLTGRNQLLKIVQSSLPKICEFYIKGGCKKGDKCDRIHICVVSLKNLLCTIPGCMLSHDFLDEHNKKILSQYSFDVTTIRKLNVDYLLANILFPQRLTVAVEPDQISIRLCQNYIKGQCNDFQCEKLHVCKEFLVDQNNCRGTCSFSHDPFDNHNSVLLKTYVISPNRIWAVLQNSFPRWCKTNCLSSDCGMLHFCVWSLDKRKCVDDSCTSSHNFLDKHNTKILTLYGFNSVNDDIDLIIENVLFSSFEVENGTNIGKEYQFFLKRNPSGRKFIQADDETIDKDRFRIIKSSSQQQLVQIVCPKQLKMCCNYWRKNRCNKQHCGMIHICKRFIQDNKQKHTRNTKCLSSHSLLSEHNQRVLKKQRLDVLSDDQLCVILRLRYPTVCKDYVAGFCAESHADCPNVHVCPEFLREICNGGCDLNHLIGLCDTTGQTMRLMKEYYIQLKDFSCSILLPQDLMSEYAKKMVKKEVEEKFAAINKKQNIQTTNSDSQDLQLKPTISCDNFTNSGNELSNFPKSILKKSEVQSRVWKKVITDGKGDEMNKGTLDFSKMKRRDLFLDQQPTEMEVLEFLLNNRGYVDGYQFVSSNLFRNLSRSDDMIQVNQVLYSWFEEHRLTFRVKTNEDFIRKDYGDTFYLCVANISPCYDYWLKSCTKAECDRFHICKKFLYDKPHTEFSCEYSHEFRSYLNLQLILKNKINTLSVNDLKSIMYYRYPEVCRAYFIHGGCINKYCDRVHICGDFLEEKCTKPNGLCNFAHDEALSTRHTSQLMRDFHFSDPQEFKKAIIYWKDPDYVKKKNSSVILKCNFDWLVKAGLCHNDLIGLCDSCNLFHSRAKLPYEWQYFVSDTWKSFDIALNKKVEECYCDPVNSSYDVNLTINSQVKSLTINNNKWDTGIYNKSVVQIRRLSTKSSVKGTEAKAGLTVWKWYWKNGNKWQEYDNFTTSQDIEKAYLANPKGTFTFKTDEFTYNLSFNSMEQQNTDERYKTKREVRRRPVFRDNVSNVTQVIAVQHKLPTHWPISVNGFNPRGGRIDVDITTRTAIEKKFRASIGRMVKIIDIEEVCNAEFYATYQSKKTSMTSKLGSVTSVNEMLLYHGTSSDTVDGICAQNFDWRLCGTNGTVYGQGSYFAKNASYSHSYSSPDVNRFRYMFVSKVLVGRYANGNSSMKRPPPVNVSVDEHTLYDSCVDDVTRPTIYVVFERDQCYPQYLITFIDDVDYINYHTLQAIIKRQRTTRKLAPLSSSQISASVSSTKAISSATHHTLSSSNISQYSRISSSSNNQLRFNQSHSNTKQQNSKDKCNIS